MGFDILHKFMVVHLGKYSQSSYVGTEKCVLCAQLFVVLCKNTFTAQNHKYTCAELSSVHANVDCVWKS